MRPEKCQGCSINSTARNFIQFTPSPCKLLVVTDTPEQQSIGIGTHLAASTLDGITFNRVLQALKLSRTDIGFTTITKCIPKFPLGALKDDSPDRKCFDNYLREEISKFNPKVILAAGPVAARILTGFYGPKQDIDHIRGYAIPYVGNNDVIVIPTYSPGMITAGAGHLFKIFTHDVNRAYQFATSATPPVISDTVNYQKVTAIPQEYYSAPIVSFDLETEFTSKVEEDEREGLNKQLPIISIQLSISPGEAIFLDWNEETAFQIVNLFNNPDNPQSKFVGHYIWNFDIPVLKSHGISIDIMKCHDTLAMWHHYQPDLPASLGFISSIYGILSPWKHLMNADPIYYGCRDADAVFRIFTSLRTQMMNVKASNNISLWDGYLRFVQRLRPILTSAEERGIPRNRERMAQLAATISDRSQANLAQIMATVPPELHGWKEYKTWPLSLRPRVKELAHSLVAGQLTPKGKPVKPPVLKPSDPRVATLDVSPYIIENGVIKERLDFNPLSSEHLKTYFLHYGLIVPKNLSGDETTGRMEVELVAKKLRHISNARTISDIPVTSRTEVFSSGPVNSGNLDQCRKVATIVVDFLTNIFHYRKYTKAASTYVTGNGWTPDANGRIHTTFLLSATATGQLSSRNPNVQNLTKGKDPTDVVGTFLGKELRRTLWAEPDHVVVELDYSGCHILTMGELAGDPAYVRLGRLDAHSFVAAHMIRQTLKSSSDRLYIDSKAFKDLPREVALDLTNTHLSDLDSWLQLSDSDLVAKLSWVKSHFKGVRNDKAKPCIAEDQLVLTDKGLVPIQNITLDHRVWDGIEWVSHSGLIYKGIKEVITYDGLTATPDHNVYTKDGRKIPFQRAASEMVRLETTGNGGQVLRTARDNFREYNPQRKEKYNSSFLSLHSMWSQDLGGSLLVNTFANRWLQTLQQTLFQTLQHTWKTLRCYYGTLLQFNQSCLSTLRWAWNCMQLYFTPRVCSVGYRQSSSRRLYWNGDRPNQQRWRLRTGQSPLSNSWATNAKHKCKFVDDLQEQKNLNRQFQQSFREVIYTAFSTCRKYWRRYYCVSNDSSTTQDKGLENDCKEAISVRVYDIANAGPRHRFTVSNKLVANCVLGNQLGLGARKLYMMNDQSFSSQKEAEEVQETLRRLFPKVAAYQSNIRQLAQRQSYLISRHGFIRRFDKVQSIGYGGKLSGGPDAEKAGAFLVQNGAFGIIREAMIIMDNLGLLERYQFNNSVHDSLVFHMHKSDVVEGVPLLASIMEQPSNYIKSPEFPNGLRLTVEASIGPDWASLTDLKIINGEVKNWPDWFLASLKED